VIAALADGFRLYVRYIAVSLRGQLQYRVNFVLQSLGQFLVTGIEFLGLWALFDRFGSLKGWTLPEVALLYGMISISFALSDALSRGFDLFGGMVRTGDFDRLLLRPRSTVLQLAGHELTIKRVGRLLQGLFVLLWATTALPVQSVQWTAAKVALLVSAMAGGTCLFFGLVVIQATIAFWTTETLEIMNSLTYGGEFAAEYPMSIYRPWFRRFFTFVVPLAGANYLPGLAILGKPDPLGTPVVLGWLSPLSGPLFLLLSLQLWRVGVRRYCSTGS
jgi:ABC-2 type transport system permease protein